jgi:Asp-tRNA(Asn)/Glu-tRNA(Gln) amidotransferase A subunit family amidase
MRRYYPENQDTSGVYTSRSVERLSIRQWMDLWNRDPREWFIELRDRPKRFDKALWQRAIRLWNNELPRESGNTTVQELSHVPFVAKDLYDVAGEVTACSSGVLLSEGGAKVSPAAKPAWLVGRLLEAGAVCAGRSNMNEFAYGLDGRNARTGDCPHPLDRRRIAGGSSSGSAWAVASGVVPFALGTDTGGSIRLPAALCGIYGLRLGWDASRLDGVFPLAHSMDTVGWFTARPEDMELLVDLVLPDDDAPGSADNGEAGHGVMTIGTIIPPGIRLTDDITAMWKEVQAHLDRAGFTRGVPNVPEVLGDPAVDAYNVIGSTEAWEVHEEWIRSYGDLYDPVVKGLIERGAHWSPERRDTAEEIRSEIRDLAHTLFDTYDLVVLPATVIPTPRYEEADGDFRKQTLRLNTFASLAGLPALTLPVHFDALRSGGIQVVAPVQGEHRLMRFMRRWLQDQNGAPGAV